MKFFNKSASNMRLPSLIGVTVFHVALWFVCLLGIALTNISIYEDVPGEMYFAHIANSILLCTLVMILEYRGKKRRDVLKIAIFLPIIIFFIPSLLYHFLT